MTNSKNNPVSMKNSKTVIFTDRSVKSVDLLLKDINKYSVLSNEEEYDLWERMQKGCSTAREKLINSNMRFVVTMAKKFTWSGVPLEDLIVCGTIGLTLAADHFDANRGYRFLTYAVWWIESELKKAVTDNLPYTEMASLEAPFTNGDDEVNSLLDIIESRNEKAPDWALTYLSEMNAMKQRVRNRYFDEAASIFEDAIEANEKGLTIYDIARKYKISEEHVRQLLSQIKRELKEYLSSHRSHYYPLAA